MASKDDRLTCADFRARRERMGISRCNVQKELDISQTTVFRWETPKDGAHKPISKRAWEWLIAVEAEFDLQVRIMVRDVVSENQTCIVTLVYPHTSTSKHGADYDRAIVRTVGERLMAQGIDVTYVYEDTDDSTDTTDESED